MKTGICLVKGDLSVNRTYQNSSNFYSRKICYILHWVGDTEVIHVTNTTSPGANSASIATQKAHA